MDTSPNGNMVDTGSMEREIITVQTKLKATNIGHKMLSKMGWKEGEGLGASGQGMLSYYTACGTPLCILNAVYR